MFPKGFLVGKRLQNDDPDDEDTRPSARPDVSSTPKQPKETKQKKGKEENMRERCMYIPLRLTLKERKALRLVEASLGVNDYTTKVDDPELLASNSKRTHKQMNGICALLSSVITGSNYEAGQEAVGSRDFAVHKVFLGRVLELARRHKIMNPEKMRSEYGKLVYLLQDSNLDDIQNFLEFSCVSPIKTVHSVLTEAGIEEMMDDAQLVTATRAIVDDKTLSRRDLQKRVKAKYDAIDAVADRYATRQFDEDDIKQCIYAIGDNNTYLSESRDVIEQMIHLLKTMFKADQVEDGFSLAIQEGVNDSRLTHTHERQYHYILQSLTLWKEVSNHMFKLWWLAEADLLDPDNPYELKDTGQGHQRVQNAPRTFDAMEKILGSVKAQLPGWVGSSLIHMGDHNVPNALMFIDKYAQVPRILNPILRTLTHIDRLSNNPSLGTYFHTAFGGTERLKKLILVDFFRSAFDGSGADNFFDAGSCIDGRLTSAWNWCSKLNTKPFFPAFRLAGFAGFDGTEGFAADDPRK